MREEFLKYNIGNAELFTQAQYINIPERCNGMMFTNIGDTIAFVNGQVIFPNTNPATGLGDSRTIGGNRGELLTGVITLAFDTVAPGVDPRVEFVFKCYLP